MIFDDKKIWNMRKNILIELDEKNPSIAEVVRERGYLVSAIIVSTKKQIPSSKRLVKEVEKSFVFYDFTRRQEDHMENLVEYSTQLYDKFEGTNHPSLSV